PAVMSSQTWTLATDRGSPSLVMARSFLLDLGRLLAEVVRCPADRPGELGHLGGQLGDLLLEGGDPLLVGVPLAAHRRPPCSTWRSSISKLSASATGGQ